MRFQRTGRTVYTATLRVHEEHEHRRHAWALAAGSTGSGARGMGEVRAPICVASSPRRASGF